MASFDITPIVMIGAGVVLLMLGFSWLRSELNDEHERESLLFDTLERNPRPRRGPPR